MRYNQCLISNNLMLYMGNIWLRLKHTGAAVAARMKSWAKLSILEILATIILAILIFLTVNATLESRQVEGCSMNPGFEDGQRVLVVKASYWFGDPHRGDVIIFQSPNDPGRTLIKRVIGLPGEWVEIKDGKVYIDDEPLDEPYIQGNNKAYPRVQVPEGNYFVMGDNRNNSTDSRRWGMLTREAIIGRAWLCYWPLSAWHLIEGYAYGLEQ